MAKTQRYAYMSSRPAFFLWTSIKVDEDRKIRFSFPIPIYTLFILADIVDDFACLWRIFGGKKAKSTDGQHNTEIEKENFIESLKKPTPEILSAAVKVVRQMLYSICFQCGTCDLVDIDITSEKERVSIKLLLR